MEVLLGARCSKPISGTVWINFNPGTLLSVNRKTEDLDSRGMLFNKFVRTFNSFGWAGKAWSQVVLETNLSARMSSPRLKNPNVLRCQTTRALVHRPAWDSDDDLYSVRGKLSLLFTSCFDVRFQVPGTLFNASLGINRRVCWMSSFVNLLAPLCMSMNGCYEGAVLCSIYIYNTRYAYVVGTTLKRVCVYRCTHTDRQSNKNVELSLIK